MLDSEHTAVADEPNLKKKRNFPIFITRHGM